LSRHARTERRLIRSSFAHGASEGFNNTESTDRVTSIARTFQEADEIDEFFALLNSWAIEFIVVGGVA
jgi:hypothetical protein